MVIWPNWQGHLKRPPIETETAFAVIIIDDEEILYRQQTILSVLNRRELQGHNRYGSPIWGKPEGIGLPGGGVKKEEGETPYTGVLREVMAETGVKAIVSKKPILTQLKLIVSDKETERFKQEYVHDRMAIGHQVKRLVNLLRINPNRLEVVLNPIYTFIGRPVNWRSSKLREEFVELIRATKTAQQEIARKGIMMGLAEPEEKSARVLALNIEEYAAEIKGIGLYPFDLLGKMFDHGQRTTGDASDEKNNWEAVGDEPTSKIITPSQPEPAPGPLYKRLANDYYYYLHLDRIRKVLKEAYDQKIALLYSSAVEEEEEAIA